MTLSRQLILLVVSLVLLLFVGTFLISASNTRDYLESQLASHAQDAATSLGLSATSHVKDNDSAMVTAMVNAMFHRGDYLSIRVETLEGEAIVERQADDPKAGAPAWFTAMFELHPPLGSATMMSGWHQVGTVKVVSHPGLAYAKLWSNSRETLTWFMVGALVVLLAGLVGLRLMLQPLKEVEWQADAICNREFPVVDRVPFTLEFRRVVEAMNRLADKVNQMLLESERLASRLREKAYQDPVTGLANKRQFMDVLDHRVEDEDVFQYGGLLLLQVRDFKDYNQKYGYPAGDKLLQRVAQLLTEETADLAKVTCAHMSGADFALLVEDVQAPELQLLAEQIAEAASALYAELELPSADVAHVGGVVYTGQSVSELLSEADLALRQAQRSGANAWSVNGGDQDQHSTRTAAQWRELIEGAIAARSVVILRQPVYATADRALLHEELFLRLVNPNDDSEVISAGVFMPMAESNGMATAIDRAVLDLVLDDSSPEGAAMAVNMSPASLEDQTILQWLKQRLAEKPQLAARLILEWPEYGATAHVPSLQHWIAELSPLGVRFSLDHFGRGFASFAYLRDLKAHFLKVDGSYLKSLETQPNNQFFLQALAEIARGLEMQVLAESVETESVWMQLAPLGVDGGRGYWLAPPA